jgi:hypothetical protein
MFYSPMHMTFMILVFFGLPLLGYEIGKKVGYMRGYGEGQQNH